MLLFAMQTTVMIVTLVHGSLTIVTLFLWTHPSVRGFFALSAERAAESKSLVTTMAYYHGFTAIGLAVGLWLRTPGFLTFFLGCSLLASFYKQPASKPFILILQRVTALISLCLLWLYWI